MTERHPSLQRFLDGMLERMHLGKEQARVLVDGSDHPYQCRCPTCLEWWATMGPEEGGSWGPFTEKEIQEARRGNEED